MVLLSNSVFLFCVVAVDSGEIAVDFNVVVVVAVILVVVVETVDDVVVLVLSNQKTKIGLCAYIVNFD